MLEPKTATIDPIEVLCVNKKGADISSAYSDWVIPLA